ncbi:MAG: class I SAM-dependent rRNA methyltransferase [Gammaproteobacteria bacterium]|nr:class I SAM-dependent rRNA methyltransferase [Gammaproteobacteria bacterium]
MLKTPTLTLKKGKAKPFWHHHPWVYSGAILKMEGAPGSGDFVTVTDHQKQFIAKGFFEENALIQARLISWNETESLEDCLIKKITAAVALRTQILKLPSKTTAYRLFNSEGDGASGIIIDQYEDTLVMQYAFPALSQYTPLLWEMLKPQTHAKTLLVRSHAKILTCLGPPPPPLLSIMEYGVQFYVDLQHGQKTGFYCDQRENRTYLPKIAKPKRVLDAFCYTGGFGVHLAATLTPQEIVFLDDSQAALDTAKRNMEINNKVNGIYIKTNVFREVERRVQTQERFDTIILDPPKLAPNQKSLPSSLKALIHLNANALKLLEPEGIFVTCECSGDIKLETFLTVIQEAALAAGKELTILKISGAGEDHPIHPACPENVYLKVLFCRGV